MFLESLTESYMETVVAISSKTVSGVEDWITDIDSADMDALVDILDEWNFNSWLYFMP